MNDGNTGQASVALLCGAMEHLACYLRTKRLVSAHITAMLLERIGSDPHADPGLAHCCANLSDAVVAFLPQGTAINHPATPRRSDKAAGLASRMASSQVW